MDKLLLFIFLVSVATVGIIIASNQGNTKVAVVPSVSPTLALDLQSTPSGQLQKPTISTSNKTTPSPTTASDTKTATKATITTAKGDIVLQLYPQDAPKTVTNFATLARRGYYNGITFHRVEDWVIQGGDPSGDGSGGTSIYGATFVDELNPKTQSYKEGYKEGVLAMANRGPNTNGSQFFILKKDTPLNHAYTIFGKVTAGMDVVKTIAIGDKMIKVVIE